MNAFSFVKYFFQHYYVQLQFTYTAKSKLDELLNAFEK